MILPFDRSQSTSGYIEFKTATNGWTRIRNLTGIEPYTIIPDWTMITLPTWGSIVGSHTVVSIKNGPKVTSVMESTILVNFVIMNNPDGIKKD